MKDRKPSEIVVRRKGEIAQDVARDASAAAVGALVGVALGGVPGALAGAAATPILTEALKLASGVFERRKKRAEAIIDTAMKLRGLSCDGVFEHLSSSAEKTDDFVSLINQAVLSDPSMDAVLAAALGELIVSVEESHRERVLIVADALKGLRSIHMRILHAMHNAGGTRHARDLAEDVGVPEIELRGVVRELELRGLIKDLGKHPVEWQLRELGCSIVEFGQLKRFGRG